MQYPGARRASLTEILHGVAVDDPYRWLEDAESPETVAWSHDEDACWQMWIAGAGVHREALVERLDELIPAWKGPPLVIGERRFWMERARGQDHAVLWVSDGPDDSNLPDGSDGPGDSDGRARTTARRLVDPNALSADATVTLDAWSPSIEGDRVAYQLSSGGDEESALWVLDAGSGEIIDGPIDRTRYSSVAWLPGGQQLYFVRRLPPDVVPEGQEAFHRRLWLHTVGQDATLDVMVWGEDLDPTAYIGVTASRDGRWLAVTSAAGTAPRNDVWVGDLSAGAAVPSWRPLQVNVDSQAWPMFDTSGTLWLLTDRDAPRRRLCTADPADPQEWREVIPEDPDGAVLEDVVFAGPWVAASRRRHGISELALFDRQGISARSVSLPGAGSAGISGRPDEGPELWVTYTDFATPPEVWHLDPGTGALQRQETAGGGWDAALGAAPVVDSRQIVVTSADGTDVRVTVVYPLDATTGVGPDRPRPTILYGYGGFGVALTPSYSSSILAWVRAGGNYAVAHLRGGTEEGEEWHRAGMRGAKQRVFEDFEAAADALVAEGWTTNAQLGIMGGSNGGLLVGAALTRSPERYRAVVCSAPLLDMVRYERFGLGATWNDEYGRADDPTEFGWLLGYSPYHHVEQATCYPSVLFTTFDGDTRVDPLHARKLCAALQWATTADPDERPVLLRRESGVGHGARAVRRTVELSADQLTFLAAFTGLELPST